MKKLFYVTHASKIIFRIEPISRGFVAVIIRSPMTPKKIQPGGFARTIEDTLSTPAILFRLCLHLSIKSFCDVASLGYHKDARYSLLLILDKQKSLRTS